MTTYTHDGIIVTHFKDGHLYFDEDGRSNFFAADEAAAIHAAYLAAHTPPAQPQPGERWLLGMDLGSVEQPVEVIEVGGELYFAWQDGGTMPRLERVADRHPSTYRRAES